MLSTECNWGSFGNKCAHHCHCYQNASCNMENGTCSNGACAAGWQTHSCSKGILLHSLRSLLFAFFISCPYFNRRFTVIFSFAMTFELLYSTMKYELLFCDKKAEIGILDVVLYTGIHFLFLKVFTRIQNLQTLQK